jgi:thiol-disulfide isomerase/thioredoxin
VTTRAAWLALALLAMLGGCSKTNAEAEPSPQTQPVAPVITLPAGLIGVDGPGLLDEIRRGSSKAALINVWASWCGSCKAELPMMVQLRERYRPLGIDILFVSVDEVEQANNALQFMKELNVPPPAYLVLGPLGSFKETMSPRWPGSLPASFLFDATGKLRYFWGAQVFEHELTPVLDGFLAGKNIDGAANFMVRDAPRAPR